jgi:hypothetical protein
VDFAAGVRFHRNHRRDYWVASDETLCVAVDIS